MVSIGDSGLHVELIPGSIAAFLPKLHLSDHRSMCDALMLAYRADDVIDHVVYLGKSGGVVSLHCAQEFAKFFLCFCSLNIKLGSYK